MALEIKTLAVDGVSVVAPAGQLDARAAPDFEKEVLKAVGQGKADLVIDFSALDYVASAGLRVLIMAGKRVQSEGSRLVLCALNPSVRQVFDVAGFSKLFPIHASRGAALEWLSANARIARIGHLAGNLLHKGLSADGQRPGFTAADPERVAYAAELLSRH